MRYLSKISLAAALGLAFAALGPGQAAEKHLTILFSGPDLTYPPFVHCVDVAKAQASKLGDIDLNFGDGQHSLLSDLPHTSGCASGVCMSARDPVISHT